jgi:hypothetical protein
MWSKLAPLKSTSGHLKIGQNIRWTVAAARRKRAEEKHDAVRPKVSDQNMWSEEAKPRGQAMWSKAFESREANSHLKDFSSSAGVVL